MSAVENSCGLVLLVLEVVGALMLLLILIALDVILEGSHPPASSILFRAGDKRGCYSKTKLALYLLGLGHVSVSVCGGNA